MSFDVVLMAIVVGGIGLSGAYLRAEYIHWREHGAAARRRTTVLRELHAARLSEQQDAALLPSILKLQGFGEGEVANPEITTDIGAGRRSAARTPSPRTYPFAERRKRARQRAAR
jgi:hypothetical protein